MSFWSIVLISFHPKYKKDGCTGVFFIIFLYTNYAKDLSADCVFLRFCRVGGRLRRAVAQFCTASAFGEANCSILPEI